jgi:hypothetical protein
MAVLTDISIILLAVASCANTYAIWRLRALSKLRPAALTPDEVDAVLAQLYLPPSTSRGV